MLSRFPLASRMTGFSGGTETMKSTARVVYFYRSTVTFNKRAVAAGVVVLIHRMMRKHLIIRHATLIDRHTCFPTALSPVFFNSLGRPDSNAAAAAFFLAEEQLAAFITAGIKFTRTV